MKYTVTFTITKTACADAVIDAKAQDEAIRIAHEHAYAYMHGNDELINDIVLELDSNCEWDTDISDIELADSASAAKLGSILNWIDERDEHEVIAVKHDTITAYYDCVNGENRVMCTDMTLDALCNILESYEGDAEHLYKAFEDDAVEHGFARTID